MRRILTFIVAAALLIPLGTVSAAGRLGPGARVATVQVDSGLKYLGGTT
jgi:hypothetical protein